MGYHRETQQYVVCSTTTTNVCFNLQKKLSTNIVSLAENLPRTEMNIAWIWTEESLLADSKCEIEYMHAHNLMHIHTWHRRTGAKVSWGVLSKVWFHDVSFKRKILPHIARYNHYITHILLVYVGICLGYSPKGTQLFPFEIQVYFSIDPVTFGPRDERSLDLREEEFEPLNVPFRLFGWYAFLEEIRRFTSWYGKYISIPLFTRFFLNTFQVVVWDFWTINSMYGK